VFRPLLIFGLILLLSIVGCGAASDTQFATTTEGKVQISTCGARGGIEFKLHGIDCEIANTLIVMLDGRALRQSIVFFAEGKRRGAWVCTSPTHSLFDREHCQQGPRFFTAARTDDRDH
jgi:hypothetical protein